MFEKAQNSKNDKSKKNLIIGDAEVQARKPRKD